MALLLLLAVVVLLGLVVQAQMWQVGSKAQ
jgi:hypothetical protein